MANLMGKIMNFRKEGPGVGKKSGKSYTISDYWRILKSKFFGLIGLNLIFCVFLVIVLLIIGLLLNTVISDESQLLNGLKSNNVNSVYTTAVERMENAYKIDENKSKDAWSYFSVAVKRIKSVNETALADSVDDGNVLGFDSSKYSQDDRNYIADNLIAGFEKLGFDVKITDKGQIGYYELIDASKNSVAKLTYICSADGKSDSISIQHSFPLAVTKIALIILCFSPIILLGPINLGMTKITRDYVREEPTFLFSDLLETFKKNWWQSFVITIIEYLSVGCAAIALIWYYTYISNGIFYVIGFAACLLLTFIFISMHFYVPLMQVTLDLSLRKIYKNAFYFTIIGMFKNILMIFITFALPIAVVALLIFGISSSSLWLVVSLTVTAVLLFRYSFWYYTVSFLAYPSIQKYVIDPYYAEQSKSEQQLPEKSEDSGNNNSSDDGDDSDRSEYVYHNGRMVHRSVLEQQTLFTDDIGEEK